MDLYEVIKNRRSVRNYKSTPIPQESLDRIWEAVRLAPSACNIQPWRFLVLRSPELRNSLRGILRDWAFTAPLLIVALGNREAAWKRDGESIHPIDVAIATEHLVLAAASEGLGTCWICAFNRKALQNALEIPREWDVVAVTPLGYPGDVGAPNERKPLSEIVKIL